MKNKYFLLLIFGLSVLTLLYVGSRRLPVELSYKFNERSEEKRSLEKRKRELNLELSVLQSPRRIEEKTKEKFGLQYSGGGFQKKMFLESKEPK